MCGIPLAAQEPGLARKFSASFGVGGAIPRRDLSDVFITSPLFRFTFGYRPWRYIQADAGIETAFHSAGVDFSQQTIIGNLRVRDNELFVPLGARGVLPLRRLELFAGGGGVYFHYNESVEVPGGGEDSSFHCEVCTSRGGWGYYGTAGANFAIDRKRRFWIGAESRYLRANTSGDFFGPLDPAETKDAWINTAAVFTVRFP